MPSLDRRRTMLEHTLRAAALAALGVLGVRFWTGTNRSTAPAVIQSGVLDSALVAWSFDPPERASITATRTFTARERDWLVALRRAGLGVQWQTAQRSGDALIVEAAPLGGAARITTLGSGARSVVLSDRLGPVDSAATGRSGALTWRVRPVGAVTAVTATSEAVADAHDSLAVRPVLVVGPAGWESKFVVAALEEDGWTVAARLSVAPGTAVRQRPPLSIDTAHVSAVIVLDSMSPLETRAMRSFVNDGGGVIASGPGVRNPALFGMVPRVTSSLAGEIGGLLGPEPWRGLAARSLAVTPGSVPLETRNGAAVVSSRRIGAGRVVAVGYDETWRARMAVPDENAPQAHRDWWSSLVAGVARLVPLPRDVHNLDEAPFAATLAALGAPNESEGRNRSRGVPWDQLLAALAGLALLAEWLSRRLRGVP